MYSLKTIHNVSSQFISCQKICKKYVSTSNRVPHADITYFIRSGETLKVNSIRYSNFSISSQITNRYCASSCIKLTSNITIEFYVLFIRTDHIESM